MNKGGKKALSTFRQQFFSFCRGGGGFVLVLTSHFFPFLLCTSLVPEISGLTSFLFLLRSLLGKDAN